MTDRFDDHPTEPAQPGDERPGAGMPGAETPDADTVPFSAGQPPAGEPGQPAAGEPGQPPVPRRRGAMRYQDPGTARPRPPSLAEQRARQVAERERRQREIAEAEAAVRKGKLRRRLLIGGGVTVGVVALVSIWYAASRPKEVTAYCVADDDVVSDDNYCDERYVNTGGGYYSGGFFFVGGRQYHYHYGGNPTPLGQRITGGSTVRPQGANITTRTGKSIQRGGFGIRSGSGKSSGS
jgi:hypothetical protein